jgi:hypothetical protein
VRLVGLGQLKKSSDLIATFRLSTVPQPTTLPRTPHTDHYKLNFPSMRTKLLRKQTSSMAKKYIIVSELQISGYTFALFFLLPVCLVTTSVAEKNSQEQ